MPARIKPGDVVRWIENHIGDSYEYKPKPGTIKVIRDPKVDGTFAARFYDLGYDEVTDLLFVTGGVEGTIEEILDRTLEGVEFESWPPQSGSLKFFI